MEVFVYRYGFFKERFVLIREDLYLIENFYFDKIKLKTIISVYIVEVNEGSMEIFFKRVRFDCDD